MLLLYNNISSEQHFRVRRTHHHHQVTIRKGAKLGSRPQYYVTSLNRSRDLRESWSLGKSSRILSFSQFED